MRCTAFFHTPRWTVHPIFLFLFPSTIIVLHCGGSINTAQAQSYPLTKLVRPSTTTLSSTQRERYWQLLANDTAASAYQAFRVLSANPKQAVALLQQKLKPATAPKTGKIATLMKQLNAESYRVRIRAYLTLKNMGARAEPALATALRSSPSTEVRQRALRLLKRLRNRGKYPKEIQLYRALELLEHIGSDEAKAVLKRMAQGAPGMFATDEATAALQRLQKERIPVATGKVVLHKTMKGHTSTVSAIAVSADGKMVASGSYDNTIRLWDAQTGKEKVRLTGNLTNTRALQFTPDGKSLVSAHSNRVLYIWNLVHKIQVGQMAGHTSTIRCLAVSPDGKLAATGSSDKTIRLWDIAKRKCVGVLTGHSRYIYAVAFSPDGKTLASSASDRTVRLWDIKQRRSKAVLQGLSSYGYSIAFSPDGKTVYVANSSSAVRSWEILNRNFESHFQRYRALYSNASRRQNTCWPSIVIQHPVS